MEVTHGNRRWLFPREDCVLLPVANTTAELLAQYIADDLAEALEWKTGGGPSGSALRSTNATDNGVSASCRIIEDSP